MTGLGRYPPEVLLPPATIDDLNFSLCKNHLRNSTPIPLYFVLPSLFSTCPPPSSYDGKHLIPTITSLSNCSTILNSVTAGQGRLLSTCPSGTAAKNNSSGATDYMQSITPPDLSSKQTRLLNYPPLHNAGKTGIIALSVQLTLLCGMLTHSA